jgi:hypothetical protein
VRALLASALALAGCGGAAPQVQMTEAQRLEPGTLYPMNEGAEWVYDVDTGGDEPPTLGIFEVIEADGSRRSIANVRNMDADGNVTHGEPIVYELEPEGIRHLASGGWVLRGPIREGASWDGMGSRTARVSNLDVDVEVFAGTFERCVEVEETGGADGRTVRTVYCPEVGPVLIESRMESELTMRTVVTQARLRTYSPGGSDDL